ncbi:MAG: hypothetical protein MZV63_51175 [Marinilabiliales bacterium]|nr:hypothetical protein [Marinilabiliales bacterium]
MDLALFILILKDRHKGFIGIIQALHGYSTVRQKLIYVIDLHDVLRSKILRIIFRLSGVPVSVIDKGRSRKESSLSKARTKTKLKHSVERYCDVFCTGRFSC